MLVSFVVRAVSIRCLVWSIHDDSIPPDDAEGLSKAPLDIMYSLHIPSSEVHTSSSTLNVASYLYQCMGFRSSLARFLLLCISCRQVLYVRRLPFVAAKLAPNDVASLSTLVLNLCS
jgi:hypothetical protein